MITAILLSYKRQQNIPKIIESLRGQTVPVEIWLINNLDCKSFGEDRSIHIPWNAGEWARYVFAPRAKTEYVMFQDDDWLINDSHFVESAINIHLGANHGMGMVGIGGREIFRTRPHYTDSKSIKSDGSTNFLWGHFQLFKCDDSKRVMVPSHPYASDIHWSLEMSKMGSHWVSSYLRERLVQLDEHGVGLSHRENHMEEREQACVDYFARFRS